MALIVAHSGGRCEGRPRQASAAVGHSSQEVCDFFSMTGKMIEAEAWLNVYFDKHGKPHMQKPEVLSTFAVDRLKFYLSDYRFPEGRGVRSRGYGTSFGLSCRYIRMDCKSVQHRFGIRAG